MDIGNLKKYFDMVILKRGYDYYIDGKVKRVISDGKKYEALVNGNMTYKVRISTDEEKIENLSCTCPYYRSNTNCKHIAAVLYYLKDKSNVIENLNIDNKISDNKYINYFNEEIIKNGLYDGDCIDYDMIDEFICFVDESCKMALEHYSEDKENIFNFIRYLYEFIYKERWIKYVEDYYDEDEDYYYDEDYDEIYDLFYDCNGIVNSVIEEISKDDEGYDYIINWLKFINVSDIQDDVLEIIIQNTNNERKAQQLYDVVNNKINSFSNNNILYITILYILESKYLNPKNAIQNLVNKVVLFRKDLSYIDEVIETLYKYKEYKIIVDIIKEFRIENEEKYRKILIESYSYVDKDKYYNYIKEECFKYKSIDYYKILREKYTLDECITYYLLVEREGSLKDRILLYKYENQKEKIYDLINNVNLETFSDHIPYLYNDYNEKIIEKYKNDILNEYYKSYNLSKKVINYIWKLSDLDGSENAVKEVISSIKKKGKITDGLRKELDFIEKTIY